ncbi:TPA: hypothetical protein ACGO0X_001825, partial [Streptococcus suis]
VIIIIKHEMENEQLLIGIARFFICEKLVFAQPLFYYTNQPLATCLDECKAPVELYSLLP